jgi:hypothetical protein
MSGSLASAKAKRAGIAPTIPVPAPQPVQSVQGQQMQTKLTFQQIVTVIDGRLTKLEQDMKSKVAPAPAPAPAPVQVQTKDQVTKSQMEEMENKFMMLAEEITTMKDVIMKLQAFTMDVNKTLFEERIQIMSDVCTIKADDIEEKEKEVEKEEVGKSSVISK